MILRPFKKIKEQEEEIGRLLHKIRGYEYKEKDMQRKEKAENHNVGIWCNGCKNLLTSEHYNPIYGKCVDRFCKLDCKCEDRNESNS